MFEFQKEEKTEQEEFEAKENLLGFFRLLFEVDRRINPHLYEDKRDTNNAD